jgi:hypothetical protein
VRGSSRWRGIEELTQLTGSTCTRVTVLLTVSTGRCGECTASYAYCADKNHQCHYAAHYFAL